MTARHKPSHVINEAKATFANMSLQGGDAAVLQCCSAGVRCVQKLDPGPRMNTAPRPAPDTSSHPD